MQYTGVPIIRAQSSLTHRSELQTLGHSPRDDGCSANGKYKLKEPLVVLFLWQPTQRKQLAANEGVAGGIAISIIGIPVCKGVAEEEVPCSSVSGERICYA